MRLAQALGVVRGDVVAFVGAGGKTAALVALAHELAEDGWRVLATTTRPVPREQLDLMPRALRVTAGPAAISTALSEAGFVFVYGHIVGDLAYGPPDTLLADLLDNVDSDALLVEADDADGLPFKAPFEDEPYIPPDATLVVPVVSLAALGQPLDDAHIYNATAMHEQYGFGLGTRVKSPWVAQVLRDDALGLRGVPARARVVALLNGANERGYLRARARLIARLALRGDRLHGVAIGSVRNADPISEVRRTVGAVVLAAGMSSRMGEPKLLLPWADGRTIIEHVVYQLVLANVAPIVVVTGAYAAEVRAAVKPWDVTTVFNRGYKTGEMLSSLNAGLRAMPPHVAASLIVLGDQPRLQPRTVAMVLNAYAEGAGDIVAPSYERRRGHPILIDRRYWADLQALPPDGAPRDVINANAERIAYVNVENDSVLRDVDTPQDYREERHRAGLG